jgi:hypothetical protein
MVRDAAMTDYSVTKSCAYEHDPLDYEDFDPADIPDHVTWDETPVDVATVFDLLHR